MFLPPMSAVEIRASKNERLARSPVEPPVFERLRRSWFGLGRRFKLGQG